MTTLRRDTHGGRGTLDWGAPLLCVLPGTAHPHGPVIQSRALYPSLQRRGVPDVIDPTL